MIEHLTTENFKKFYEENNLVLIDFWAPWCGPCRMLAPVLEQLDQEIEGLAIGKINVDEEDDISEAFAVSSIPTLILFKNGTPVDKKIGFLPAEALKTWIKQYE